MSVTFNQLTQTHPFPPNKLRHVVAPSCCRGDGVKGVRGGAWLSAPGGGLSQGKRGPPDAWTGWLVVVVARDYQRGLAMSIVHV